MLVLLPLAFAAHAETSFALNDAGITLDLGPGWHMSRWSDWDFDGRTDDNAVFVQSWYTAYQQPIDAPAPWVQLYTTRVTDKEHATDVRTISAKAETVTGRPTLRVVLDFGLPAGGRATMHGATFAVDGKMMHVELLSASRNDDRAARAMDGILARLSVQKPAADISALGTLSTDAADFALPAGWRVPLPSETETSNGLLGEIPDPDAAKCARALRPRPGKDGADLMLVCEKSWTTGFLDAYSFDDDAHRLVASIFGKAADKVDKPERIELADRNAALVRPSNVRRLGIVPWRDKALAVWVAGEPGHEAELDRVVQGTLAGARWKGDDHGLTPPATAAVLVHTLQYRPTHPLVLLGAAVLLGVFGGLARLVFRRPSHEPPTYMM